tara:strand:- start:877 stop:1593 length:717 start_codon:yes stop_codon:yes gene_type:complete
VAVFSGIWQQGNLKAATVLLNSTSFERPGTVLVIHELDIIWKNDTFLGDSNMNLQTIIEQCRSLASCWHSFSQYEVRQTTTGAVITAKKGSWKHGQALPVFAGVLWIVSSWVICQNWLPFLLMSVSGLAFFSLGPSSVALATWFVVQRQPVLIWNRELESFEWCGGKQYASAEQVVAICDVRTTDCDGDAISELQLALDDGSGLRFILLSAVMGEDVFSELVVQFSQQTQVNQISVVV